MRLVREREESSSLSWFNRRKFVNSANLRPLVSSPSMTIWTISVEKSHWNAKHENDIRKGKQLSNKEFFLMMMIVVIDINDILQRIEVIWVGEKASSIQVWRWILFAQSTNNEEEKTEEEGKANSLQKISLILFSRWKKRHKVAVHQGKRTASKTDHEIAGEKECASSRTWEE